MSQYLPTGNFKWLTDKQIAKLDLAKYHDDSDKGLILEVDLEYSIRKKYMNSIMITRSLRRQKIYYLIMLKKFNKNSAYQSVMFTSWYQH